MDPPTLSALPALPGPFDILELAEGQTFKLRPVRIEVGSAVINPRDGRSPKAIQVVRVWVDPADKLTVPAYWDVTSAHLGAAIQGYMAGSAGRPVELTIRKLGAGPAARFQVVVGGGGG